MMPSKWILYEERVVRHGEFYATFSMLFFDPSFDLFGTMPYVLPTSGPYFYCPESRLSEMEMKFAELGWVKIIQKDSPPQ
jgi:hypothetical protein